MPYSPSSQGLSARGPFFRSRTWNFIKPLTEKRGEPPPAVRLGLVERALDFADVLKQRIFPTRVVLPERLAIYYWRDTITRRIPRCRRHALAYAQ